MQTYTNMFASGDGNYELFELIGKLRQIHLESGGDPTEFPNFLEENGIKAIGPLIKVDDNAKAMATLLKD